MQQEMSAVNAFIHLLIEFRVFPTVAANYFFLDPLQSDACGRNDLFSRFNNAFPPLNTLFSRFRLYLDTFMQAEG